MSDNRDGELAMTKQGYMFVVCDECVKDERYKRLRKREPDPDRERLDAECAECGCVVYL